MNYTVRLYDAEGLSADQHRAAAQRFCRALEDSLGDASLVLPVYQAWLRIAAAHGEQPASEALTDAEREIVQQWQAAETAAITAVYGPLRGMGDGMYEIKAA